MRIRSIIGDSKLSQLPALIAEQTTSLKGVTPDVFLDGDCGSGLVFCPHASWKHGAELAGGRIREAFPDSRDKVGVYHGKLAEFADDAALPIVTQDNFKRGKLKLLACTKAFGMGIDKPDIRFTLHFNIPPSLESFYQEAGRAGRDNEDAQCWILYAGTPMAAGGPSLDYELNHDFHTNSFPGADIEEAKVFEMLSENRTPGRSVVKLLASLLFDETGVDYYVRPWANGVHARIYLNHPDYRQDGIDVFVDLAADGGPIGRAYNPFPGHERVLRLVVDWLNANKPTNRSVLDWVFDYESPTVSAGIEELLTGLGGNGITSNKVCLAFDNGYIEEIAERSGSETAIVGSAFAHSRDADGLLAALAHDGVVLAPPTAAWVRTVFPKIRLREHTFRAIYRLTVLGAVNDFEVDYKDNTVTADLNPQPPGGYRAKLRQYVERYAPMDVDQYLKVADESALPSELRRCLHALIQFVYARIAKQRVESLRIMEQTAKKGLEDANAFSEAVTTFFDSKYLPILRPFLNEYTPDLVFKIIEDTAGGSAQVSHLYGACNRLLPENPDNAAFHALRAYTLALLGYADRDVSVELTATIDNFEKYFQWSRSEKLRFLTRLRFFVAGVKPGKVKAFDATIIEDHAAWARTYMKPTEAADSPPGSGHAAVDDKKAIEEAGS